METPSISWSCNNAMPDEGMEQVQADLEVLKKLYALLHNGLAHDNLDVTSRAYLTRMLNDATQKVVQRQAKVIAMPDKTGMEQVRADLEVLKKLYALLHNGSADENLDVTSRAYLMRMLDDATQKVVQRQAKMKSGSLLPPALERNLSIRSDRQARAAGPRQTINPSPSPSLISHGRAFEGPVLSRLASNRSSRTAVPPRHHPSREQPNSVLSLCRLSLAATSQHVTVTGRSPRANLQDRTRPSSDHGDHSSVERHIMQRFVSRKLSQGWERLHADATVGRMGAEGSYSTRHLRRLGSGLSLGMTSRRGSKRAGRGAAMPRYSSSTSSNEVATIRSRIRPHRELTERCLRRVEEGEITPQRRRDYDDVSDSLGTYTSPTLSPPSSTYASSYSSPVSRRGNAPPTYASEASDSLSRRRCQERKERRQGHLRRLTKKIARVFHHRHDHHHHHHYQSGKEGPSRSDRRAGNHKSTWRHLGALFRRTKGQDKKATNQKTVSVLAKKRGGSDRHMDVLSGAMRHFRGKRKAQASIKMTKMISRVKAKKIPWWQQLRQRRGQPRRRLGHGKAATL